MRKEREGQLDPNQPALVVTYGNTTRKQRPLDRDLLVLGRAACCDFGLVSPEVAPIHCVILRTGDGWRIRDCTGRGGTRLNGKAIHEELLSDGDTLQIGTFSFQLNLPRGDVPNVPGPPIEPSQFVNDRADVAKMRRLQRSRERLARRALSMRRQLRDQSDRIPVLPEEAPTPDGAALDAKRAELDEREKKLQALEAELKEHDHDLRDEHRDLERQRKELQKFSQDTLGKKQAELDRKTETLLAERRAELEAEAQRTLEGRRAELDRRDETLRERERQLDEATASGRTAAAADLKKRQEELDEQLRQVEALNAEVKAIREALRLEVDDVDRLRQMEEQDRERRVREAEVQVAALWQQCEEHRRGVEETHGPLVVPEATERALTLDLRARELHSYAQHLRRKHQTLSRYEEELGEAYRQFHEQYDATVQGTEAPAGSGRGEVAEIVAEMRQQSERLRTDLAAAHERIVEVEGELSGLRDVLQQRDQEIERLTKQIRGQEEEAALSNQFELAAPEDLLALTERLRSEIAERDSHIRGLNRRIEELEEMADPREKEAFEAELNNYRVELEQDRARVNEEIARLQAFQAQLEQTKQETELQHSRERVVLAREWAEINRLRDQLRREQGHSPIPETAGRERAIKSKQVKGEPPAPVTPPPTQSDLISRLKRVRRTKNDGTT